MSADQLVETRIEGDIARLRLNRTTKRNALDSALIEELTGRLRAVPNSVRFLVLESADDRAFCAGADRAVLGSVDAEGARQFITALHQLCESVRSQQAVTIAAVGGHCIGAGLELAASCDFRVANPEARFSMPEVLVGIPSVIEAALLPRLIGWGPATDLMLTGRVMEAEEAARVGLVQRLASRDSPARDALGQAVESLIDELREACPRALAAQKRLFRIWQEQPLAESIAAGVDALAEAYRPIDDIVEAHRRLG